MRMYKLFVTVKKISPLLASILILALGLFFSSPITTTGDYLLGSIWAVIAVLFAWVIWLITRSEPS